MRRAVRIIRLLRRRRPRQGHRERLRRHLNCPQRVPVCRRRPPVCPQRPRVNRRGLPRCLRRPRDCLQRPPISFRRQLMLHPIRPEKTALLPVKCPERKIACSSSRWGLPSLSSRLPSTTSGNASSQRSRSFLPRLMRRSRKSVTMSRCIPSLLPCRLTQRRPIVHRQAPRTRHSHRPAQAHRPAQTRRPAQTHRPAHTPRTLHTPTPHLPHDAPDWDMMPLQRPSGRL